MYTPSAFREERLPAIHAALREIAFATLVTPGEGGLQTSHLPMHLVAEEGPCGTLYGHVARNNPHWQMQDAPSVAMFLGPHCYVSPSWYPGKRTHGREVPTWNYLSVHAHGVLQSFDDPASLRLLLRRLTDRHEAERDEPWRIDEAPDDYLAQMMKAIVGVRLPVARYEAKFKLSQNRTHADRQGVIAGLEKDAGAAGRAVAAAMRQD